MNKERCLSINLSGLRNISDANRLKEFSCFLYLKSLYSNSCIFNYTQVGLAKKSGLPLSCIKKNVKSFLSSGWCRIHKGNLVFNKVNSFSNVKHGRRIKIEIKNNLKEIHNDLCLIILKQKQNQFNRYAKLKADLNDSHPIVRRRAMRYADKHGINEATLPGEGQMLSMSIDTISKLIGCSTGKASSVIKQLKISGRIDCFTNKKIVIGVKGYWAKMYVEANQGCYYHNGLAIKVSCNEYNFNK